MTMAMLVLLATVAGADGDAVAEERQDPPEAVVDPVVANDDTTQAADDGTQAADDGTQAATDPTAAQVEAVKPVVDDKDLEERLTPHDVHEMEVEAAQARYNSLHPNQALLDATRIIEEGDLAIDQLTRLYVLSAKSLAAVGEGQKAQRFWELTLRVSPDWRPSPVLDEAAKNTFNAALAGLPPRTETLSVGLRGAVVAGAPGVEVRLLGDDKKLVYNARLTVEGKVQLTPLEQADPLRFLPITLGKEPVRIELLDRVNNVVLSREIPAINLAVGSVQDVERRQGVHWMTVAGGGLLAVGLLGVSSAGVMYSAAGSTSVGGLPSRTTLGFVVLGFTGLLVGGGALVATDLALTAMQ